ncbi:MAG: AgmX/PglI C-terminal domain-containing protein [Anaeromyxobacteraceae bacterium]
MPNELRETTSASAGREWVFKSRGQVFGPVPEDRLAALVEAGEVAGDALVAGEDGAWRPLAEVPALLVHLRRAEARARVEAEVTVTRRLARRRGALRGAALAAAALVLLGLAGGGAWWVAARKARSSALLEDFGEGIAIGEVRVGAPPVADDEVAVPELSPATGPGASAHPKRAAPARSAAARGSAQGGDLVLAQYDPRRIQERVARQQGSLAPCLRDEAKRSPEFTGEIPVSFAIGNDGRVVQLWVEDPRFKSGELRDCLHARLAAWSFEPFPGQRPVVSLAFRIRN